MENQQVEREVEVSEVHGRNVFPGALRWELCDAGWEGGQLPDRASLS